MVGTTSPVSGGATRMTGAEALVRHVKDAGISICFANPGTTEMHLVDALSTIGGVQTILGMHENVVSGAADGYARMTRTPAMTLLHLGPGLSNGLESLHNAKRAGSKIFNVVGTMANFHASAEAALKMDAMALARTVSCTTEDCTTRSGLDTCVHNALLRLSATAPPGESRVASLLLSHDVQWESAPLTTSGECSTAAPATQVTRGALPSPLLLADELQRLGDRAAILLGAAALCEPMQSGFATVARHTRASLLCDNGVARADRGLGRPPELIRVPQLPQQAAKLLAQFELILFVDAVRVQSLNFSHLKALPSPI